MPATPAAVSVPMLLRPQRLLLLGVALVTTCTAMPNAAVHRGESADGAAVADASGGANVLVLYVNDQLNSTGQLAWAVARGAAAAGANVTCEEVQYANYKRDVAEWADAVLLGSGVYNQNPAPQMLQFINSFDFMDDLSHKVGGAFATGGASGAGVQPVIESISRGLETFRFVVAGGDSWQSAEGTVAITNVSGIVDADTLAMGAAQGARAAAIAAVLKGGSRPTPGPTCKNEICKPPPFGGLWTAKISANLTQPGYDAGLVIVNFTTNCSRDPSTQQMKTVYGDFYTVLTRCDLGWEFTIAPASRNGTCLARKIGVDVDKRICGACGCPFCVRDTNGSYTHGQSSGAINKWNAPVRETINGQTVDVWRGRADSTGSGSEPFALATAVAFDPDWAVPMFINVSHPLWVTTAASVEGYSTDVNVTEAFAIPIKCPRIPPSG